MEAVAHVQAGHTALLLGFEPQAGFSGAFCPSWQGGTERADARLLGEVEGGGSLGSDPVATARLDLAGL